MPRKWITTPLPIQGSGGEQPDAAPGLLEPGRARLLRNAIITGPGAIAQAPDWLKGDVCKNLAGPVEGHAVCGIWPFAQQGGASAPSAGVALSFNGDADAVYLHQVGELVTILRTLVAYADTDTLPPQVTGFEMFGKFYFVPYAREVASARKGLFVFDPTGAGAITNPTFVLGGGAAHVLGFRGISRHRGATILGWAYGTEADIDEAHILRYCRYGTPDTWVPDTTDLTAGFINVGTLKVPIVACGMSGQYTIIGKETEIFALDGDFSAQFYVRQIGKANGPVSTVGLVELDDAAVWISIRGPAMSQNGQPVELLAIDRVMRRFLSYMDLTSCWGAHDSERSRIVWGVRRKSDDDGVGVTNPYLTDLFWWDYERHAFGAQSLPSPIFSVGFVRGPGTNLQGPVGVVSAIVASGIQDTLATVSWTPGDASPDVTFEVQQRVNGTSPWVAAGTTLPGVASKQVTGLVAATLYDVQVRQVRNGQVSAYVQALALFTTAAAPVLPTPAAAAVVETGETEVIKGKTYSQVQATWTPFTLPTARVRLYRQNNSTFPGDGAWVAQAACTAGQLSDPQWQLLGDNTYYWLRTELVDGSGVGTEAPCTPFPLFITGHR